MNSENLGLGAFVAENLGYETLGVGDRNVGRYNAVDLGLSTLQVELIQREHTTTEAGTTTVSSTTISPTTTSIPATTLAPTTTLAKPVLQSITVEDATPTKIIYTYDLDLDETSVPDITDFSFSTKTGTGTVVVSGKTVTCTVTARYYWGDSGGTTSYTPGANPIKSTGGGEADSLTDEAITNNCALDATTTTLVAEGRYTNAPSDAVKALINRTIIDLKTYNGLSKADCCWVFGNYESLISCQNWVENDHNVSLVNSPTHVPGSRFNGDGSTSYINTDFIPSSDAVNFQLGSESIIVMSPVLGDTNNRNIFGVQKTAAPITVMVHTFRTAANEQVYINSDGTLFDNLNISAGAYMGYNRSNTTVQGYVNGSPSGATDTVNQASLPAYQIKVLCSGSNNTPASHYNGGVGFLWLGGGLTDAEHLGIVQTMQYFYSNIGALL